MPRRHAHARAHEEIRSAAAEGRLERAEDALRDVEWGIGIDRVLDEHSELVTAHARDGVAAAQHFLEPSRDGHDHCVALDVAERIVDRLEIVEVDEKHRQRQGKATLARHRVLQTVDE